MIKQDLDKAKKSFYLKFLIQNGRDDMALAYAKEHFPELLAESKNEPFTTPKDVV